MKILTIVLALIMLSFKGEKDPEKLKAIAGTFGVCDCNGTSKSALTFELKLNEDFTFQYINNADPKRAVETTGVWVLEGNTIVLKDYQAKFPINNKWKIDQNDKCIKSRKGIEFTRLCKIKPCL